MGRPWQMFSFSITIAVLILTLEGVPTSSCNRKRNAEEPRASADDSEITCRDESARQTKWFIAYKLAKIKNSPNTLVKQGKAFAFISDRKLNKWTLSEKGVGQEGSPFGNTLHPLYHSREDFLSTKLFLLYNDQPPNRTSAGYNGHTKGVIIANRKGGIWLQHSVPKFPEINTTHYKYPSSGVNNAQLFFCITLKATDLETIGNMLLHTKPIVFAHSVPDSLEEIYPSLARLVGKKRIRTVEPSKIFNVNAHGLNMTIFAKGPKFEKEIYEEWVAPRLQSDLKVQSWLNGANSINSSCKPKKYQILNISDKQVEQQIFSTSKDHSKWAITWQNSAMGEGGRSTKWTCISDLNRMESQKHRGGSAVCINSDKIWDSFDKAILDVQPCGRN